MISYVEGSELKSLGYSRKAMLCNNLLYDKIGNGILSAVVVEVDDLDGDGICYGLKIQGYEKDVTWVLIAHVTPPRYDLNRKLRDVGGF